MIVEVKNESNKTDSSKNTPHSSISLDKDLNLLVLSNLQPT